MHSLAAAASPAHPPAPFQQHATGAGVCMMAVLDEPFCMEPSCGGRSPCPFARCSSSRSREPNPGQEHSSSSDFVPEGVCGCFKYLEMATASWRCWEDKLGKPGAHHPLLLGAKGAEPTWTRRRSCQRLGARRRKPHTQGWQCHKGEAIGTSQHTLLCTPLAKTTAQHPPFPGLVLEGPWLPPHAQEAVVVW